MTAFRIPPKTAHPDAEPEMAQMAHLSGSRNEMKTNTTSTTSTIITTMMTITIADKALREILEKIGV